MKKIKFLDVQYYDIHPESNVDYETLVDLDGSDIILDVYDDILEQDEWIQEVEMSELLKEYLDDYYGIEGIIRGFNFEEL